eukprot:14372389-Alexandrium_andersonii.AAC.1
MSFLQSLIVSSMTARAEGSSKLANTAGHAVAQLLPMRPPVPKQTRCRPPDSQGSRAPMAEDCADCGLADCGSEFAMFAT